MGKNRFTESQIVSVLKELDGGQAQRASLLASMACMLKKHGRLASQVRKTGE
jgi:hypothetical protein